MLAGLSKAGNRQNAGFRERAGRQTEGLRPTRSPASVPRDFAFIRLHPLRPMAAGACRRHHLRYARLFVESDVFHAIAVVNAVNHGHEPFDIGLGTGRPARTAGIGASRPLPSVPTKGPLTEPAADARPRGWGLLFIPRWGHSAGRMPTVLPPPGQSEKMVECLGARQRCDVFFSVHRLHAAMAVSASSR
jgi:hypothetical protein